MSNEELELIKVKVDFLERENKGQQELINVLGRVVDSLASRMDLMSERIDLSVDEIRKLQEQGKDDGR